MSRVYEALKKAEKEVRNAGTVGSAQKVALPRSSVEAVAPDGAPRDSPASEFRTPGPPGTNLQPNVTGTATASAADKGRRLRVDEHVARNAQEHFLSLASTIRSSIANGDKRVVLVTSSVPGEGKSFVTLNLAVSLVRISMPTLVIDADLRAPSNYYRLNLGSPNGLLTYLEGRARFADCVHETSVPGLSIIPSGGISRVPLETFVSARMNDFIASVRDGFHDHCVLVDSPSGLSVPEVRLLRNFVDAALIVVAANHTPRTAVNKTLELLKDIPVLGLVLNSYKVSLSAKSYFTNYSSDSRDNGRLAGSHH